MENNIIDKSVDEFLESANDDEEQGDNL